MSNIHSLKATTRKRSGSAALKQMRREGLVPAVLYGSKEENLNLKVEAREFRDLLQASASENILVNLRIEDVDATKMALIQDVQHHALSGQILHADFHAVSAGEQIHASVPIELEGTPAGVKEGGLLEHQIHAIEVHCLPKDLPEVLAVDVSHLKLGEALHVAGLPLPEGVAVHLDGEVVVALVSEPKVGGGETEEETAVAAEAPGQGEGGEA